MSENQKDQSVQRNQVGNQKKRSQGDQSNENENIEFSENSSGSEEEEESTEEIKEQEDFNHPHKQGNPIASEGKNENGI